MLKTKEEILLLEYKHESLNLNSYKTISWKDYYNTIRDFYKKLHIIKFNKLYRYSRKKGVNYYNSNKYKRN